MMHAMLACRLGRRNSIVVHLFAIQTVFLSCRSLCSTSVALIRLEFGQ